MMKQRDKKQMTKEEIKQSMDRLEIYIPMEAEVNTIHLDSLPASLLKRMGLPLHDSKDSKKLALWINPAILRRKGQKLASCAGKDAMDNTLSLLGRRFRPTVPLKMQIVSPNGAVCNMLKDMTWGKTVATRKSYNSVCPLGSPPQTGFTAMVIYRESVYLCISKHNPSQSRRDTCDPQLVLSTHSSSSESQKKDLLNDNRPRRTCTVGASQDSGGREMQDQAGDEAQPSNLRGERLGDVQTDCGGVTNNSNQSCSGRESQSVSLERESVFHELEREEKIAQMKARLQLNEAALNCLPSSK